MTGIVVLKQMDVHNVSMLSTKHVSIMISSLDSTYHGCPLKQKPLSVLAYNDGKTGSDRSNQLVSYATTIRKIIKWYWKLALHVHLGTSIVNHILKNQ